MSYPTLTIQQIDDACHQLYPEMMFGKDVDNWMRVEAAITRLERCDDLTPDEQWKVNVLLPNLREILT